MFCQHEKDDEQKNSKIRMKTLAAHKSVSFVVYFKLMDKAVHLEYKI